MNDPNEKPIGDDTTEDVFGERYDYGYDEAEANRHPWEDDEDE